SHHGRAPGAIAQLINTTLRQLVAGMDASDVVGVWNRIYQRQLVSHGMGQATCLAMSGLDQALWDLRGKAVGWPVYKLLGGKSRAVPAYAGGISLGFQPPAELVQEAQALVAQGYRALKLRFGDTVARDIERLIAVRQALGSGVTIMVDANTGYTVSDVRAVMPAMQDAGVLWLEEPFPPHDRRSYRNASELGRSLGVSDKSVRHYVDVLEQAFMVRQLQPWHENVAKRQVKAPKIYVRDSGLLHAMLGLETRQALHRHPKVGASFEGFALETVLRSLSVRSGEAFFWATHGGAELDLLVVRKGKRLGFEFKRSDHPTTTKSMHTALEDLRLERLTVVVPGRASYPLTERIDVRGLANVVDGSAGEKS
ncbi:MAG: DUF4143 domain-containing protein, partial [Proteobacteria bacterium]